MSQDNHPWRVTGLFFTTGRRHRPGAVADAAVGLDRWIPAAAVGEYLGGSEGLGHEVVTSLNSLDAPSLFAVIVLLAAMGSLLYLLVTLSKRLVIPWHESVARQ